MGWFERLSNFEYLSTFDSESFELELKLRTQWEIRFRLMYTMSPDYLKGQVDAFTAYRKDRAALSVLSTSHRLA